MSDGGGDDLVAKQKEFLDAFFKKGAEFTEELLRENEKLRFRVVQLEEQLASSSRSTPSPGTLKELVEKIHSLEQEREQLIARFSTVEQENRQYEVRFHQIERENNNLASLYVASYQLHSTLDLHEVLRTVVEILLNFVGAKTFAILFVDEETGLIRPVVADGVALDAVPAVPVGQGLIGGVCQTGEPRFDARIHHGPPGQEDPAVCVPLRVGGKQGDRVVGAIAIWDFLGQKTELFDVDYEIFNLLGAHAASALEAARLASASGPGRFRFAGLAGLL